MTRGEVVQTMAVVRQSWPHSDIDRGDPAAALELWFAVLRGVEFMEAEAAIYELLASGREHAPPVGVIVKTVARRRDASPDWDEAWAEAQRMIRRRGMYDPPAADDFSHPMIGAFAVRAWSELCLGPAEGTNGFGTHYAQQREAYAAMRGRAQRDASLGLVGAPRRRGELKRLDMTAITEGGSDARA